jgi:acyl transferase domain-containing protein
VPSSRWPAADGTHRWGAFLDDVAGFDADYFGIDAAEAAVMDPHARIFLEVAHEALERAGYAGKRRRGRRIGVFVAVGESDYPRLLHQALDDGARVSPAALVGNLRNLIAARVSQSLDLSGPAMAIDTACSSALSALHLARRSLAAGECDVAVVGGVSLNLTPTPYRLLEAARALSPTGRCRAFSHDADGFVPGEGAAALVLEPLTAAQEADDRVLAVVRGSAMNNDGRSLSLMAPNPLLQQEVIADAYRQAGIDPTTVGYVEAHGTGTAVGDPIEARSLVRAFPPAPADSPRWLGSVKTNVGHLLNAAGMPSLLKVVMALQYRRLPASLHYTSPSSQSDLTATGFQVVTQTREWTSADGPLRAGINGFGFGGTNVHAILEEAPPGEVPDAGTAVPGPHLLTLSAASEPALRAAATELAQHARSSPHIDEADLCAAVASARDDGPHRLAVVADGDLTAQLEASVAMPAVGARARQRPRLVFMFPGQGAQVPGMARRHHTSQPVYRRVLADLLGALDPVAGRSLLDWSLDDDVNPGDLACTAVAQPLLVADAIAIAHQLEAWGVRPDAVVGHSVGEFAAAAVTGALDPHEAVHFAAERGRLVQEHSAAGAMAWVRGAEADVRDVVAGSGGSVCLAAFNGPAHFVLAGPKEAVGAAVSDLAARGCQGGWLAVSRAFHSPMMAPVLEPLGAVARQLSICKPRIPLLSTVTAQWNPTFDAAYFSEHAVRPVQFGRRSSGCSTTVTTPSSNWGPGPRSPA